MQCGSLKSKNSSVREEILGLNLVPVCPASQALRANKRNDKLLPGHYPRPSSVERVREIHVLPKFIATSLPWLRKQCSLG